MGARHHPPARAHDARKRSERGVVLSHGEGHDRHLGSRSPPPAVSRHECARPGSRLPAARERGKEGDVPRASGASPGHPGLLRSSYQDSGRRAPAPLREGEAPALVRPRRGPRRGPDARDLDRDLPFPRPRARDGKLPAASARRSPRRAGGRGVSFGRLYARAAGDHSLRGLGPRRLRHRSLRAGRGARAGNLAQDLREHPGGGAGARPSLREPLHPA